MKITWRKSSFSGANGCVEVGPWKSACDSGTCVEETSTFCSSGSCVAVTHEDHRVLVRDSKLKDSSPVIEFTPSGWRSFLIVAAEWDRRSVTTISGVILDPHGEEFPVFLTAESNGGVVHLGFTWDEWDAFIQGVNAGEFLPEALTT
jgi:hypothetical protein